MSRRTPLPNRRCNVTVELEHRGQPFAVTLGFDAAGTPREVFANGPREGSDMQHVLSDACVVLSIAMQHGIPPAALARSLGTVPDWSSGVETSAPASPFGAILAAAIAEAAE